MLSISCFIPYWQLRAHHECLDQHRAQGGGYGAFQPHEANTIAVALDQAGYHTGLFGKYMNDYNTVVTDVTHVPPGWDQFVAFQPDESKSATRPTTTIAFEGPQTTQFTTAPNLLTTQLMSPLKRRLSLCKALPPINRSSCSSLHIPSTYRGTPRPDTSARWPDETAAAIPAFNEGKIVDKPLWVRESAPRR